MNDPAVKLLIRETHETMCHARVQTVMCQLREKFWILSTRKALRSIIKKCVICNRYNSKPMQVLPAPLSIHRVKDAAVFEVIGVDFAVPVYLRGQKKAWICLYTCAIYRVVYLELVTSLSTNDSSQSVRKSVSYLLDLNSRYQRKQEIMEHLRNRFRKEYLGQLISKVHSREIRKLSIGDVVLVEDDARKRIDWL